MARTTVVMNINTTMIMLHTMRHVMFPLQKQGRVLASGPSAIPQSRDRVVPSHVGVGALHDDSNDDMYMTPQGQTSFQFRAAYRRVLISVQAALHHVITS